MSDSNHKKKALTHELGSIQAYSHRQLKIAGTERITGGRRLVLTLAEADVALHE
jgi:hypothetical protein